MKFTLNRSDLEDFLDLYAKLEHDAIADPNLSEIINGAFCWQCEVSLLPYFFSKRIQRKQNANDLRAEEIPDFYNLADVAFFNHPDFNTKFIDYMFDYSRSKMNLTLEELLIELTQDFNNSNYGSAFRY